MSFLHYFFLPIEVLYNLLLRISCHLTLFLKPCPTYSSWTEWGSCTVSCGGGLQERSRTCVNNTVFGVDCEGDPIEYRECNNEVGVGVMLFELQPSLL